MLLAIRVTESKIALKSGFEKYLRVDKDAVVRGISDAVGAMEQWEPVFQVRTHSQISFPQFASSVRPHLCELKHMRHKKQLTLNFSASSLPVTQSIMYTVVLVAQGCK